MSLRVRDFPVELVEAQLVSFEKFVDNNYCLSITFAPRYWLGIYPVGELFHLDQFVGGTGRTSSIPVKVPEGAYG